LDTWAGIHDNSVSAESGYSSLSSVNGIAERTSCGTSIAVVNNDSLPEASAPSEGLRWRALGAKFQHVSDSELPEDRKMYYTVSDQDTELLSWNSNSDFLPARSGAIKLWK
jgi:hypothetical protein